jgi:thiol:disulfide interchange protein
LQEASQEQAQVSKVYRSDHPSSTPVAQAAVPQALQVSLVAAATEHQDAAAEAAPEVSRVETAGTAGLASSSSRVGKNEEVKNTSRHDGLRPPSLRER